MRHQYYKLDDFHNPVPCSMGEWAGTIGRDGETRIVKHSNVGEILVSTVFLGLDHNFREDGPPILFETMVFGGELDQFQERYSTWDEALSGHTRILAMVIKTRIDADKREL